MPGLWVGVLLGLAGSGALFSGMGKNSLEFGVCHLCETTMAIRTQTSKGRLIRNFQESEVSHFHRNLHRQLEKDHGLKARTEPSASYNCHGLTFASRRTRVEDTIEILKIIEDDRWEEIENIKDVKVGDIVIYWSSNGEANHSGIVVQYDCELGVFLICSKWNLCGEFVHAIGQCPDIYGPTPKFYRCLL